jgi:8-oxo-dGTP diphosphatase
MGGGPYTVLAVMADAQVQAAGGVVVRSDGRVAVIHRPRYDDWSLPKGKLDPGESFEDGALREVREETGIRGRIVDELAPTEYVDRKGRDKLVRWYRMVLEGDPAEFAPNDEVDELRWLTAAEARDLLSYDHDRALVGTVV